MPEIISYHDREKDLTSTMDSVAGLGIRRIANILTLMVVLLAVPITLVAVQQVNTVKQRAAGSTIKIAQGSLNTAQTPWVVILSGENFNPLMKAKLFDGDTQWGSDLTVIFENSHKLSIQLPSAKPPSECIIGRSCNFSIQLIDPSSSFLSNNLPLTIN